MYYVMFVYVFLSQFKGYEVDKIAACTLLLEGTAAVSTLVLLQHLIKTLWTKKSV